MAFGFRSCNHHKTAIYFTATKTWKNIAFNRLPAGSTIPILPGLFPIGQPTKPLQAMKSVTGIRKHSSQPPDGRVLAADQSVRCPWLPAHTIMSHWPVAEGVNGRVCLTSSLLSSWRICMNTCIHHSCMTDRQAGLQASRSI
jgi:hypothetical protein